MDIKKLQRAIVDGLEDVKGQQIVVLDTEHLSPLFERVIIATGTSNRQTRSLAASVRDAVKSQGFPVPRVEGEDNGEWIIVDCSAAVVHLMQQNIRDYYNLEEIWGGKPVKMKIGAGPAKLVKASAEDAKPARTAKASSAPAKKVVAKKAARKIAPVTDVAAKKTVAKKAVKVARSEVVKPKAAAVKKAVIGKGGISRTVGVKVATKPATKPTAKKMVKPTAPVKKVAVKKVAAKKVAAKKTVAVKTVAKKVAVKKAATKKAVRSV